MLLNQVSHIIACLIEEGVAATENQLSNNDNLLTEINHRVDILTDEYLQNQFPFLAKSCSRRAVSTFIPLCIQDGGAASIEERIKVETSIKLSICEFENSGLQDWIPQGCFFSDQPTDTIECMAGLKIGGGQWWTTYSGYYQNLNELCYQYSLPFQQEQLLDTYTNLTEMVDYVTNFWSDEIARMENRSEIQINEHVENISTFFNDLLEDLLIQDIQFKEMVGSYNKEFMSNLSSEQEIGLKKFQGFNDEINYSIKNVGFLIDEVVMQIKDNNISNDISMITSIKNNAIDVAISQSQLLEDSISFARSQANTIFNEIMINLTNTQQETIQSVEKYINVMKNMETVDKKLGKTLLSLNNIEDKLYGITKGISIIVSSIFSILGLVKNSWIVIPIFIIYKTIRYLRMTCVLTLFKNIIKIVLVILLGKLLGNIPRSRVV